MLINSLKNLVSLYKNKGAEILLLEIFEHHRWPKALFSYSRLEILLASSVKPLPKRVLNNGYEVKEAKETDIASLIDLRREEEEVSDEQYQNEFRKILDFINSDNALYVATDKSKVIGFLYAYKRNRALQFSDSILNKIFMKSRSDKIILFGYGYVSLKYRMKGIFPLLLNHAVDSNPSIEMFVTDINTTNTISLNSNKRIGFSGIGNIKLFRLLGVFPIWMINLNNHASFKFRKHIDISVDSLVNTKVIT